MVVARVTKEGRTHLYISKVQEIPRLSRRMGDYQRVKYRANPVEVDAYVIKTVRPWADGMLLRLENGKDIVAHADIVARYTPVPGDYWVIQEDGYAYVNPKDVFVRKYSPLAVV
jgi:hypothetical protein